MNYASLAAHDYVITPPGSIAPRPGLLLKFSFASGLAGFADLMAWPELGDLTLAEEFARLREKNPTPLGERIMELALEDGEARFYQKSLWSSANKIPQSHYLVGTIADLDECLKKGRPLPQPAISLKVKWLRGYTFEKGDRLENRLRIDFNERGARDEITKLLDNPNVFQKVDFFEDPFSHDDIESWRWLKEKYPALRIFGDYALEKSPRLIEYCDGIILKPASRKVSPDVVGRRPLCVTHSMGHPLGQMVAALYASRLASTVTHVSTGLLPLPQLGDSFLPHWDAKIRPEGEGFGFSTRDLLQLSWRDP